MWLFIKGNTLINTDFATHITQHTEGSGSAQRWFFTIHAVDTNAGEPMTINSEKYTTPGDAVTAFNALVAALGATTI